MTLEMCEKDLIRLAEDIDRMQKILDTSIIPDKLRLAAKKIPELEQQFWVVAEIKAGLMGADSTVNS